MLEKDHQDKSWRLAYCYIVMAYANIYWVHWHAKGSKFARIHAMAEEYYDKLKEFMDAIAELLIQHEVEPINILNVGEYVAASELEGDVSFHAIIENAFEYDYSNAIAAIKISLEMARDGLVALQQDIPEYPTDISTIDEWLAYLNKEIGYKLARS